MVRGYGYKRIADELGITIDTVRRHASRIKRKGGLLNATSVACAGFSLEVIWQILTTLPAEPPLTSAELTVLAHACRGASSKTVARLRSVSPRTVQKQRENAMAKLVVRSVVELAGLVKSQYEIHGMATP